MMSNSREIRRWMVATTLLLILSSLLACVSADADDDDTQMWGQKGGNQNTGLGDIIGMIFIGFFSILVTIVNFIWLGLMWLYLLVLQYTINWNPQIYPPPTGWDSGTGLLIVYIMRILIPFIEVALLITGIYFIFISRSPKGRAKAKVILQKLILAMVLITVSPMLYQTMIYLSSALTGSILNVTQTEISGGKNFRDAFFIYFAEAMYANAEGNLTWSSIYDSLSTGKPLLLFIPILFASIFTLLAVLVTAFRFIMVLMLGILFPITIFLYLFEVTAPIGRGLGKATIMWILCPVVMAAWIAIALSILTGLDPDITSIESLIALFVITMAMALIAFSPLAVTGFLDWVGGIVGFFGMMMGGYKGVLVSAAAGMMRGQGAGAVAMAGMRLGISKAWKGMRRVGGRAGQQGVGDGQTGKGSKKSRTKEQKRKDRAKTASRAMNAGATSALQSALPGAGAAQAVAGGAARTGKKIGGKIKSKFGKKGQGRQRPLSREQGKNAMQKLDQKIASLNPVTDKGKIDNLKAEKKSLSKRAGLGIGGILKHAIKTGVKYANPLLYAKMAGKGLKKIGRSVLKKTPTKAGKRARLRDKFPGRLQKSKGRPLKKIEKTKSRLERERKRSDVLGDKLAKETSGKGLAKMAGMSLLIPGYAQFKTLQLGAALIKGGGAELAKRTGVTGGSQKYQKAAKDRTTRPDAKYKRKMSDLKERKSEGKISKADYKREKAGIKKEHSRGARIGYTAAGFMEGLRDGKNLEKFGQTRDAKKKWKKDKKAWKERKPEMDRQLQKGIISQRTYDDAKLKDKPTKDWNAGRKIGHFLSAVGRFGRGIVEGASKAFSYSGAGQKVLGDGKASAAGRIIGKSLRGMFHPFRSLGEGTRFGAGFKAGKQANLFKFRGLKPGGSKLHQKLGGGIGVGLGKLYRIPRHPFKTTGNVIGGVLAAPFKAIGWAAGKIIGGLAPKGGDDTGPTPGGGGTSKLFGADGKPLGGGPQETEPILGPDGQPARGGESGESPRILGADGEPASGPKSSSQIVGADGQPIKSEPQSASQVKDKIKDTPAGEPKPEGEAAGETPEDKPGGEPKGGQEPALNPAPNLVPSPRLRKG
ncbi:hypothetical protein ACFLRC_01750, partial [Candidatus Altiarchaeota archaeon]